MYFLPIRSLLLFASYIFLEEMAKALSFTKLRCLFRILRSFRLMKYDQDSSISYNDSDSEPVLITERQISCLCKP